MTKVELYKSRAFVTIVHLIALGQFSYALYYNTFQNLPSAKFQSTSVPSEITDKIKFLSYWSLIIQTVYFVICLVNDFIGTNEIAPKKKPTIRKVKDYLLSSLAFPIAFNVGISFWTLYAIDRELVFPKVLDAVFPGWLNHIMHTNIMVFMIVEMFTSFREYPKRSKGLTGLLAFMLSYLVWVHIIKHYSGQWVYPVLEVLAFPQRIVFFIVVLVFTVFLYSFGEILNGIVWSKELKLAARKTK